MLAISAVKRAECNEQLKIKLLSYQFVTWLAIWIFVTIFRKG